MVLITSLLVKTDITCVKFFENYVLAGVGNNIHVYSRNGKSLQVYKAFQGQRIYGIVPNSTNKFAIFGANLIKILEFDFLKSEFCKEHCSKYCTDWIFDAKWIDNDTKLVTVFSQNCISVWSTSLKEEKIVYCAQVGALYSASLINNKWDDLFVFCGTCTGEISVWKPADASLCFSDKIYYLDQHDGSIYSVTFAEKHNAIVSTSDDRTVRIWASDEPFLSTTTAKIELKHTMYGHQARIFFSKVLKNYIVTAGEDGLIHIWNFNGELIRKIEAHQGGSIWSLDVCEKEGLILTGGNDSSVSIFPLQIENEIKNLEIPFRCDSPKYVKIMSSYNLAVIMNSGLLIYFCKEAMIWDDIELLEDLKNYSVMEVSENRELIALAGINGSIFVFKEENNSLIKICVRNDPDGNRIFSIHWLNPSVFVLSTKNGILQFWSIKQSKTDRLCYSLINMNKNFLLPRLKERWTTSACLCFPEEVQDETENCNDLNLYLNRFKFAVGDRTGNIHLFSIKNEQLLSTIKKAHCHLGVTALYFKEGFLFSLGRNSLLNKYKMDQVINNLIIVSSDKLPISWFCSLTVYNDINLLFGYSGSNFIIYNLDRRRIVLELNTGGGHRSWDLIITKSNKFKYYFLKNKTVNYYSEKLRNILSMDLVEAFHSRKINTCKIIDVFENASKLLFLTGGEDTTFRISLVDTDKTPLTFKKIVTVKMHLSSIRCINYCLISCTDDKKEYLIFSAGGRGQIIVQKLIISILNNDLSAIECNHLFSFYKASEQYLGEIRVMDLLIVNVTLNIFLLIAATSDGSLRCFKVDLNSTTILVPFNEIKYYDWRCILKLSYLKVLNHHIVISMATDGKITFWDITDICRNIIEQDGDISRKIMPFFIFPTHQSGINSVCYQKLTENKFIFATGGDDNVLIINVFKFNLTIKNRITVELIKRWYDYRMHVAQITGIFINKKYVITTAIDQRLYIIKYELTDNNDLICKILKGYNSVIADTQGMECVIKNKKLFLFLYGIGAEICQIDF